MFTAPSIYDELQEGPEVEEVISQILHVEFSNGCEEYYATNDPADMETFNEHCRDAIEKNETFTARLVQHCASA